MVLTETKIAAFVGGYFLRETYQQLCVAQEYCFDQHPKKDENWFTSLVMANTNIKYAIQNQFSQNG